MVLVSSPLINSNYHNWFKATRMNILCKNKLMFVDVLISWCQEVKIHSTSTVRDYGLSCLIRFLDPSIAQSVMRMDEAYKVSLVFKERLSQGYLFRITNLQKKISS